MRKHQAGFTLVEIAIVLVIIGLLLGGVLKGQELITQARIKNVANDLNGITAAVYAYQDRYKALPGDDPNAATRWSLSAPNVSTGTVRGVIDGNEDKLFWMHLRLAGLITGDSTSQDEPLNAVSGKITVATSPVNFGLTGLVVCSDSVPGKIAEAVDSQLDDGKPTGGSLRARVSPDADPGAAYDGGGATLYKICKNL